MFYILVVLSVVNALGPYSQRFPDQVLDQRMCYSQMLGLDFINHSLSKIVWHYIEFYNNPVKYKH
jgi:hypothetical protein